MHLKHHLMNLRQIQALLHDLVAAQSGEIVSEFAMNIVSVHPPLYPNTKTIRLNSRSTVSPKTVYGQARIGVEVSVIVLILNSLFLHWGSDRKDHFALYLANSQFE